jgi:hypothetical protein
MMHISAAIKAGVAAEHIVNLLAPRSTTNGRNSGSNRHSQIKAIAL